MKFLTKLKKRLHKWFYGRKFRHIPTIFELQDKADNNLKEWKVKKINTKEHFYLCQSNYYLPSGYYPKNIKLEPREVGANILSKTRYIL